MRSVEVFTSRLIFWMMSKVRTSGFSSKHYARPVKGSVHLKILMNDFVVWFPNKSTVSEQLLLSSSIKNIFSVAPPRG